MKINTDDLHTWFTHSKNQNWIKTPLLINVVLKDPKNGLFPEDITIKMQINYDSNNYLHVYINDTNIKVSPIMLKQYNLVNY